MSAWRGLEELSRLGVPKAPGPLKGGDADSFNALAGRWRAAFAAAGCKRAALHLPDAWQLGAALLGAWSAGCEVWLPADGTAASAQALRPLVDLFVGEWPGEAWAQPPAAPEAPAQALPDPLVVVFTSGSSGDPLPCPKRLADLENELRGLEQAFGSALDGAWIAGTVSHQHIYGLLFRVLWPLCAGRPSVPGILRYPEEIAALAAEAPRLALVSSPAFLKRLPEAPLRPGLAWVSSSGGPLSFDAAQACARVLGCAPIEVYGSSETGGVAWRERRLEQQAWAPFVGVQARVDAESGLLELRSDRVSGGQDWLRTADRAQMDGAGFLLLGRADRVAKVEEKRVSLSALERALEALAPVQEARLVVVPGRRDELGAVLVLRDGSRPEGAAKAALLKQLKAGLSMGFEAVVLPRRWRVVAQLPQDAQGKSTQAALAALFDAPRAPQVLSEEALPGGGLRLRLRLDPALHWFEGHFPEAAVLPGVVQLHWAVEQGRQRLGLKGAFSGLKQLKFSRPLLPGDEPLLEIQAEPGGLRFSYDTQRGRHCSGRVLLGA
jgi:acyl-CoA synthetase (AMP-forming)/AMP-acid ligase II